MTILECGARKLREPLSNVPILFTQDPADAEDDGRAECVLVPHLLLTG